MAIRWIEVTVKLIGDDYKENVEAYCQRINFEYFQTAHPTMVAEIAAIVNDLPMPRQRSQEPLVTGEEIEALFDKQYSLYKDRVDNP